LIEKGYSERQEKHLFEAFGRGLLKEFPNPERNGCPLPGVLKRIASRAMPLSEAERWLDHLTSCSSCYRDFSKLRAVQKRRRTRTLLAIAAGILIVASAASWDWLAGQKGPTPAQVAVLDLRNRSVPRGAELHSLQPRLQVSRKATRWTIYLPLGSSDGAYDVRLLAPSGAPLLQTSSAAKLKNAVVVLEMPVDLSGHPSGPYVLQLARNGSREASYSVDLK
jgi:hypothetical protein